MLTGDFIFRMVLGHLFGDFLFQNDWMALNKKKKILPLFVHCMVYTTTVILFTMWNYTSFWMGLISFLIVFATHVFIDGTYVIEQFFGFTRGRTQASLANIGVFYKNDKGYTFENFTLEDITKISITWFVQIVADNTLHLFLMYIWFLMVI